VQEQKDYRKDVVYTYSFDDIMQGSTYPTSFVDDEGCVCVSLETPEKWQRLIPDF
jgi:hypothetical protein